MPFSLQNLTVLAYARGFTLWHYNAGSDSRRISVHDEFFEDAHDVLSPGDTILLSEYREVRMLFVEGVSPSTRIKMISHAD